MLSCLHKKSVTDNPGYSILLNMIFIYIILIQNLFQVESLHFKYKPPWGDQSNVKKAGHKIPLVGHIINDSIACQEL